MTLLFSLNGKMILIKMNVLLAFLYILRNAPVWIPLSLFKQLDALVSYFLWSGRAPRLSLATLKQPSDSGGLALPIFY